MSTSDNTTHGSTNLDLVKNRYISAETAIRDIMNQNRNLRKEHDKARFDSRSGNVE